MPDFNFSQEELISFFAVMVRFSVLIAVLPFVGDRYVPAPIKILLSLSAAFALFPALVSSGRIRPVESKVWGATVGGIMGTVGSEVLVGLVLGFTAKMTFDAIHFGANLVGNFMGFATASTYDPRQESQTQLVAEIQMAIAMLIFLAVDAHYVMLRASFESYRIIGLGGLGLGASVSKRLIELSAEVVKFGVLIASPVAVSLFAVNVAFGVMAKAMPQLNVLVLSFAVSALVGLIALFLGTPQFQEVAENIFGRMGDWMESMMFALASGR